MSARVRDFSLQLSPDEMRDLARQTFEMILEHFEHVAGQPVTSTRSRSELAALLEEPLPEHPAPTSEVMRLVRNPVFKNIMHQDHPRCFSFIPGPSNFVSVMADALAAAFNVIAADWLEASGPGEIELLTIDWLRQLCGMPFGAGGLFVSGGSMANLTALGVARHRKLRDRVAGAVIYCSDQTHSSVARAIRLLGFEPSQLRVLPSDDDYRLPAYALSAAIARDRDAGRVPFCVIANVGTTNTAAVDPLPQLVALCREQDIWLHADGAYGAAAVLCPQGRQLLQGMEHADSLTIDPHKWLFQPYEMGCVLVREAAWLKETYHIRPEYLNELQDLSGEVHFCDNGIQLTRGFRALKLWMSLKVFGVQAFRDAVAHGIRLAEFAESRLRASSMWEVVTPAQLGMITFCPRAAAGGSHGEALTQELVRSLLRDGYASITSTRIRQRLVLRMCIINPRTTEDDVAGTIERLEQLAGSQMASSRA